MQIGTQRRSAEEYIDGVKQIHDGAIGKVHFVRTWITSIAPQHRTRVSDAPPETLDFNLWAGPGPADGYRKNLVHYHWHWRWDYGTGECGNNGVHALDVARWGLGVDGPQIVTCGGDKYFFDDDQETPDTQLATFDFDGAAIQWEHRTWSPQGIDGSDFGIVFYGSDGTLSMLDDGWTITRGKQGRREATGHAARRLDDAATSGTFSIASRRGKSRTPTSKSAIAARRCATWRTSPGGPARRFASTRETEQIANNEAAGCPVVAIVSKRV